jgi:hypothetical protein
MPYNFLVDGLKEAVSAKEVLFTDHISNTLDLRPFSLRIHKFSVNIGKSVTNVSSFIKELTEKYY